MRCRALGSLFIQLFLTGALLIGCATTKAPVSFSAEAAKQIKTMDICIGLSQQEIYAEIDKSYIALYTGGGLIPALIDVAVDNHRTKKAENLILPVRQALEGYDFPKTFETAISRRFEAASLMKLDKVTLTNVVSKERFQEILTASGAQSVLFVTCRYFFDPELIFLNISVDTELLPTSNTGQTKDSSDKALYRNTMVYKKSTHTKLSREDAVKYWADDNGTRIREALDKGIKAVTNRIASQMHIDDVPADMNAADKAQSANMF